MFCCFKFSPHLYPGLFLETQLYIDKVWFIVVAIILMQAEDGITSTKFFASPLLGSNSKVKLQTSTTVGEYMSSRYGKKMTQMDDQEAR